MHHTKSVVAGVATGSLLACVLLMAAFSPQAKGADAGGTPEGARITMPGPPFGVAWGFLYGCYGVKAETFLPQLRQMGAGFTKLYLFWNQIEPEKGRFDWEAVDTFVGQLESPDEALIALFSSSTWATRRPTGMLPPSPAKDPDDYYQFVHTLVSRCKGRVRYWQNDCEPNNPVFWDGTPEEFVAELKVFYRAVKDADPDALVVCGGYDGLFNPPGMWAFPGQERGLAFFDYVLKEGADSFDVFDMRLYADPYTIPGRVAYMRQKMAELGYEKPIICTEYNGPGFFELLENLQYVGLAEPWTASITDADADARAAGAAAGASGIAALYARMDSLAPQTQMFMAGCPQQLDQKLRRMQCRDLVMRNVLALSAGMQKTLYWDLWHDTEKRDDLMQLMYAKLKLMDYEDGVLRKRYPAADALQRMTETLRGVETVRRIEVPGRPTVYLFEVQRGQRGPVYVVWERRDAFSGEDQPPVAFEWEWPAAGAKATDALGQTPPVSVAVGRLTLELSLTPIFLEPTD
jgi:hypothetical protein